MVFYNLYNKSGDSSYKLTASYLAQEGIEIIRNMRDNNWVKNPGVNWMDGIIIGTNNCAVGCDFEVDYRTGTAGQVVSLRPYGTEGNYLNIDSSGMYLYDTNYPDTIFKRKITITEESQQTIKVSSEVFWNYRGKDFSVKIEEYLYDWY